jgi:hypothetical protein
MEKFKTWCRRADGRYDESSRHEMCQFDEGEVVYHPGDQRISGESSTVGTRNFSVNNIKEMTPVRDTLHITHRKDGAENDVRISGIDSFVVSGRFD